MRRTWANPRHQFYFLLLSGIFLILFFSFVPLLSHPLRIETYNHLFLSFMRTNFNHLISIIDQRSNVEEKLDKSHMKKVFFFILPQILLHLISNLPSLKKMHIFPTIEARNRQREPTIIPSLTYQTLPSHRSQTSNPSATTKDLNRHAIWGELEARLLKLSDESAATNVGVIRLEF